jgi:hypothetical protein
MSYGYVGLTQNTTGADSATTVATPNFAVANTVHNLLFAGAFYDAKNDNTDLTGLSITLTDVLGNAFLPIDHVDDTTNGYRVAIFYAKDIAAGTNAVTAHYSGQAATSFYKGVFAAEYSGLDTSAPLTAGEFAGQEQTSTTGAANELTSGNTPTLSTQPCAAIGFSSILHSTNGPPSSGTGLTQRGQFWQFGTGTNFACLADKRVTSTSPVAATFNPSATANQFANLVAVFKEAATGGGSGTTRRKPMSGGLENMGGAFQMRGHRDVPAVLLARSWRQRGGSRIFLPS